MKNTSERISKIKLSPNLLKFIGSSIVFIILTIIFKLVANQYNQPWTALYITFLTISYHFIMRMLVGAIVEMNCKIKTLRDDSIGFSIKPYETKLYKLLKVKRWKASAMTLKPEQFDLSINSPETVLHNVMKAELVHRIIMPLSFLPLLLIIPYGAPVVFVTTSTAACLIDLKFVIIQRYNRPRLQKLKRRVYQ